MSLLPSASFPALAGSPLWRGEDPEEQEALVAPQLV